MVNLIVVIVVLVLACATVVESLVVKSSLVTFYKAKEKARTSKQMAFWLQEFKTGSPFEYYIIMFLSKCVKTKNKKIIPYSFIIVVTTSMVLLFCAIIVFICGEVGINNEFLTVIKYIALFSQGVLSFIVLLTERLVSPNDCGPIIDMLEMYNVLLADFGGNSEEQNAHENKTPNQEENANEGSITTNANKD